MPADPTREPDTVGAVLSAVGLVLVVLGILAADDNGWLTVGLVAAGALVLVAFFVHVAPCERDGKEPLLSTALFRNRISNLGLVTQNVQWLLLMGTSFVVSAYLQVVRGYDAIETGVIFTAATVGILVSSLAAERLAKRRPQRTLIAGGFVTTIVGVGRPARPGQGFAVGVGVRPRPAAHRARPRRDADAVGQRRAVGVPRGPAGRDLRPVAQHLQPRLDARHRRRRHDPGRRPHRRPEAGLRAGDDRPRRRRRSSASAPRCSCPASLRHSP